MPRSLVWAEAVSVPPSPIKPSATVNIASFAAISAPHVAPPLRSPIPGRPSTPSPKSVHRSTVPARVPIRILYVSWPIPWRHLEIPHDQPVRRSARLATHQGALARRAARDGRGGLSAAAREVSRAVRRARYPRRRVPDRRGARRAQGGNRVRPAWPVPGHRPAIPVRERAGAHAQHDLALSSANPALLGGARRDDRRHRDPCAGARDRPPFRPLRRRHGNDRGECGVTAPNWKG